MATRDSREGRPPEGGATLLAWRVHPARERPVAAALAGLFIVGVAVLIQAAWRSPGLTALAVLLVGGAAGEFLLPTRYRLTPEGAERWSWLGMRQAVGWEQVAAVYRFPDGLKLSTQARPGLLEPHRGLFLRWGEQAAEAMAVVAQRATARRRPAGDEASGEPDDG